MLIFYLFKKMLLKNYKHRLHYYLRLFICLQGSQSCQILHEILALEQEILNFLSSDWWGLPKDQKFVRRIRSFASAGVKFISNLSPMSFKAIFFDFHSLFLTNSSKYLCRKVFN